MLAIFFGLTAANLLMLTGVFALGLGAVGPESVPTGLYPLHVALGIVAGLFATFTHVAVYTYFMATSKWLRAAADKAGLDLETIVAPALARKRRAFPVALGAVVLTMIAMFAGAGADPTVRPWWPGEVHLALAAMALAGHGLAALAEYRLIQGQSALMDRAIAELGITPDDPPSTPETAHA